ncbi:hypothetical protein FACS1894120_0890 [Clostridia bacterium]|nr:hypothetical protein FACS1894120_0890 [Clostridia bacterium]
MQKFNIRLGSIAEVKEFSGILSSAPFDADLSSGKYVVDAKSIMGIFSLDLSGTLVLTVQTDTNISHIISQLKKFIAA